MTENPCTLRADINALYVITPPHLREALLAVVNAAAAHSNDMNEVQYYTGHNDDTSAFIAEVSAQANAWLLTAEHLVRPKTTQNP
jgi:hypothetical protein